MPRTMRPRGVLARLRGQSWIVRVRRQSRELRRAYNPPPLWGTRSISIDKGVRDGRRVLHALHKRHIIYSYVKTYAITFAEITS